MCPDCSKKLNYHSKKREIKKLKKERKHGKSKNKFNTSSSSPSGSTSLQSSGSAADDESDSEAIVSKINVSVKNVDALEKECWTKPLDIEDKSREEEFDEYLEDLLL